MGIPRHPEQRRIRSELAEVPRCLDGPWSYQGAERMRPCFARTKSFRSTPCAPLESANSGFLLHDMRNSSRRPYSRFVVLKRGSATKVASHKQAQRIGQNYHTLLQTSLEKSTEQTGPSSAPGDPETHGRCDEGRGPARRTGGPVWAPTPET